ncbi:MAG: TonB-dependent receptor [Pseudomonadota bacterium]
MKKYRKIPAFCSVSALTLAATAPVAAQDTAEAPQYRDEIIVIGVGSRGRARSAVESPVAIDAVNADDVLSTGATETGRVLQQLIPSFNFSSSSVSDGTDSLRPATLRGLGPDQTLVLINGKRRHKSALIHVNTSVGRGTAGTDINAIPPSAIKAVEILRDGASALYGSDAIAGVINFELKDSPSAGALTTFAGQTYESDGTTFTASANKGFEIGDEGFLNITYEYRNRENTNRAGLQGTCQFLCTTVGATDDDLPITMADPSTESLEVAFDRQSFRIGDSDSEQHVLFANLGYTLNENAEFYAFGSWGHRENESAGFFRRANQGERTLLELYPTGFLPLIRPTIKDKSLAGGIDWALTDNLMVDTSLNYGSNAFNFEIANSNNVSLGLASPTVFDAGTLELSEWSANVDAVYDMDVDALEAVTIAFGGGFRKENYQIIQGAPASFANGGFENIDNIYTPTLFDPVAGAAGAQVFRGFSPANEVDESRDSWSGYVELNADITDRVTAQAALRYENYDGFGDSLNWKLAMLGRIFEGFNLRGSVSTGFRAPSMQQLFFNSTSTQFVTIGTTTVAQERGTFRNDSALAQGLGIPSLKEEESFSWGAGVVLNPIDGFTLTVDYYSIDIDDRIMISGAQNRDDVPAAAQAIYDSVGATSGQFFINGVDTQSRGVDIVGAYALPDDFAGGRLRLSAAANITNTDVVRELPAPGLLEGLDLVTNQDISILEEWQPKTRINVGANWTNGNWGLNLQGSRYGEYTVCEGACDGSEALTQTFGAEWLADIQLEYRFDRGVALAVGANNIFDQTPDRNLIGQARGGVVQDSAGNVIVESDGVFQFSRRSAPFGFNGGFYYARVSIDL